MKATLIPLPSSKWNPLKGRMENLYWEFPTQLGLAGHGCLSHVESSLPPAQQQRNMGGKGKNFYNGSVNEHIR